MCVIIVSLQEQDQLPDGEYCAKSTGNTCTAIWPKLINEKHGVDDCTCSYLSLNESRCGCSMDGDYSVYTTANYICWSNLTHEMNRTAVFITEGETRNNEMPRQNYKYIEAHLIIVAGKLYS